MNQFIFATRFVKKKVGKVIVVKSVRICKEQKKQKKQKKKRGSARRAKDEAAGGEAAKVSVLQGGEQQVCHWEGCERTRMKGGGCPCKTVGYCCIEHQKKHWSKHKSDHKRIMKEIKRKK